MDGRALNRQSIVIQIAGIIFAKMDTFFGDHIYYLFWYEFLEKQMFYFTSGLGKAQLPLPPRPSWIHLP